MKHAGWFRSSSPTRQGGSKSDRPRLSFWILTGLLILVFLTGGSSWANAPMLFVLRPIAILVAAWGLATLPRSAWRTYRYPFALAAAVVIVTMLHLVPLPPLIWQALPGHQLVQLLDAAAGIPDRWRPLSLVPSRTLNALYALSIPAAVMLVAAQLTARDRVRVLHVLLVLASLSAILGILQAAGIAISLYHVLDDPKEIEAAGLFANQNHQAALLAAMLPMLAIAARLGHRGTNGAGLIGPLAAVAAIAIMLLLIVTGSRAGLVLGLIAIGFVLFYDLWRIDRLERASKRTVTGIKLAIGGIVIGGAMLVTILTARGLAFNRLETIQTDLRPRLWASILPVLPDYQPWGAGIGSYVEVYRSHEPTALLRRTYSNHAHNEYLEVLLTAGVPGLLLLVAAAALILCALWKSRRGSDQDMLFARLGGTIIVLLACASITDYPLRTPLLSAVFALAAIWCVGAPIAGSRSRTVEDDMPHRPDGDRFAGASRRSTDSIGR